MLVILLTVFMFLIKNKTLAIILILDKFFLQIRHLYFCKLWNNIIKYIKSNFKLF